MPGPGAWFPGKATHTRSSVATSMVRDAPYPHPDSSGAPAPETTGLTHLAASAQSADSGQDATTTRAPLLGPDTIDRP